MFVNLFSLIADQDIFDSTGSLPAPVSKAPPARPLRSAAVIGGRRLGTGRHSGAIPSRWIAPLVPSATVYLMRPSSMAVQLEERFQLQLSREEAVQYMQQLIDESVAAVFPQVHSHALVAAAGWPVLTADQSRTPQGRHAGRPDLRCNGLLAPKAELGPVVTAALPLQREGYG